MDIEFRNVVIEDYDGIYQLWDSTEQSRRAMNPVDDSREGIERYLKRKPCAKKVFRKYSGWFSKIMMLQMVFGKNKDIHFVPT